MRAGVPLLMALLSMPAGADPMAEARALGQASINVLSAGMAMGDAWTAQATQASREGTLPNSAPELAGADGQYLYQMCLAQPKSSPLCEAIAAGDSSRANSVYTQPVQPDTQAGDLARLRAGTLPLAGALSGAGVAGNYSACTTRTDNLGFVTRDVQSCFNYYLRGLDKPCEKNLTVEVIWHHDCPANTIAGPTPVPGYSQNPIPHTCRVRDSRTEYSCPAGTQGPTWYWDASVGMYEACFVPNPTNPNGPGSYIRATATTVYDEYDTPATTWPEIIDHWENTCVDYEARVPAGLLPPDGVDVPTGVVSPSGRADKCERSSSVCLNPNVTRNINGALVTRACWNWRNTFSCVDLDPRSDCNQPRHGSCEWMSTNCIDRDSLDPTICTAEESRYSCITYDSRRQEAYTDCGGQVYSHGDGTVWDTAHEPDRDLGLVAAYMEAGREAGGYLDPNSLKLFKGYDSRCRKKLFGLVNCCNKSGGAGGMFSNQSVATAALGQAAGAASSTYVYDALFVSDAPNMVINGFASVFGSGTSSAFAGLLAGQVSVEGFLSTLIPGPWTIAMMALQFSGLISCPDREKETALKRDANLCVELGAYCSRKLPLLGTCLERTYSHCCFNSVLAKSVNTQGKIKLGQSLGDARSPNCDGFTPEQRSEERRVGKECRRLCRSRWSPYH
jgi:conjugal transfer mating pair stabilization protein TraN